MELGGNDLRFLKRRVRPRYEDGPRPVRVVDLFSGCGGLSLGVSGCGGLSLGVAEACLAAGRAFELRLAMESSAVVQAVFDANFTPAVPSQRADVLSRFDKTVVLGCRSRSEPPQRSVGPSTFCWEGPPCQGHSNLNNYSRRVDPKNELYMAMVRAAEVLRPAHVIIENVHGVQRDRSSVLERAIDALHGLGYELDHRVVRLADIGVPQRRVRHILFASRVMKPNQVAALETALVSAPRTLRWAIGDLLRTPSKRMLDTPALMTPENQRRAQYLLKRGLKELAR